MIKRIGRILLFFILIFYVVVETVFYSVRWIINGKSFPDYPKVIKEFFDI